MYTFFICLLAGAGAGIGTGFAGLSAATVISPMLITFLGIPAYEAVAVSLASDVLASAVSAYTYHKSKNLDVKNGLVMMIAVLLFTMIGSGVARLVPNTTLGSISVLMTFFLGLRFLIIPVRSHREMMEYMNAKTKLIFSIIGGAVVGSICGFMGVGGGMMMLMVLTMFLGYDLKTAVGTSVFIMTFSAFTGALSHIYIAGLPDLKTLILCVIFTLLFARLAARIANKVSDRAMNIITGLVLVGTCGAVMLVNYITTMS